MDFENLFRFFVHEGYHEKLFELIGSKDLTKFTQDKIIVISFQVMMNFEAMMLGVKLFGLYEKQLINNHTQPISALINSFKSSPFLLEFKLYFLSKLLSKMNFNQIEQILIVIESHFFPGLSKKSSLLIYQINPLKTAMHLQEFLTRFVKKYPVLVFRIENLKQVVMD